MNAILLARSYSTSSSITKSAKLIRKEFLDYFQNKLGHSFIRSSPVLPLNDDTIAFVNAGMNQFKGVLLDYYDAPVTKATNSQKCIRVGGKHNDLDIVGTDGYHHTFFEMLGSWSFGDYFKKEACNYAWDLLTKHYGIPKEILYVTYFGGDEKLGLEPDLECKDVWLQIGVPNDKIIPFGLKDNFWEMGLSGPCGPCTEIHVDHTKQLTNQSARINKGYADLTELWNIVFIEHERLPNGSIVPLAKRHVDTGMGLERLVTLLQGKTSNYDTDLFQPLFNGIQKYTGAPKYQGRFHGDDEYGLDTAYRILADHSRMITVALADGVLPEKNQRLRRVIRKAIDLENKVFHKTGIITELSYIVAHNLGDVYPELCNNLTQVHRIVQSEAELFDHLQSTYGKEWKQLVGALPELASCVEWISPGLINGYKYITSVLKKSPQTLMLSGDLAFKLHDSFGIKRDAIAALAKAESLIFDEVGYNKVLDNYRVESKKGLRNAKLISKEFKKICEKRAIPKTDDSFKYEYTFTADSYKFPKIKSKIIGFIFNEDVILDERKEIGQSDNVRVTQNDGRTERNTEKEFGIILDRTSFYSFEGGQASDQGFIYTGSTKFVVSEAIKIDNYVIHFGLPENKNFNKLKIGDVCEVSINPETRTKVMKHHTGLHLLNSCLKNIMQTVFQQSSIALPNILRFVFNSFGPTLSSGEIRRIENHINSVINANIPITTRTLNSLEFINEDSVSVLPGEIYPYKGIRVVEINSTGLKSKEACCGTHVHNTKDLEHFCILKYRSFKASKQIIEAVVGQRALLAEKAGEKVQQNLSNLKQFMESDKFDYDIFMSKCHDIERELSNENLEKDNIIPVPHLIRERCLEELKSLPKRGFAHAKKSEIVSITKEIEDTVDPSFPCIVHCLKRRPAHLSLREVVSIYPTKPALIFTYSEGKVRALCRVPEEIVSSTFNAYIWMEIVLKIFKTDYAPVKDFDKHVFASMVSVKIPSKSVTSLLELAIKDVRNFASEQMEKLTVSGKVR